MSFRICPCLGPLVRKEFRQIGRDVRSLIFLLGLPAALLLLYGFALNFDFRNIPVAIVDLDRTPAAREFVRLVTATETFATAARLDDARRADELLDRERVRAVIVVPAGFGRRLETTGAAAVQVLADGSNPTAASTAIGYLETIAQGASARWTAEAMERSGLGAASLPVAAEPRIWFNPELRSALFLVPGLMAFLLMGFLVISTAFAVVREKERGTMEQIMVSPVRPLELVLGKTIPYAVISLASSHLVLLLGALLFRVPIRGSYPLLLLTVVLFLLGGLGQGIVISTVTRTQQVAFLAAALTSFLPTFILSGFVFPIRNMPVWIQAATYLVPARHFLAALRTIMLKGAGLDAVWREVALLAAFAAAVIALSTIRLRRGLLEAAPEPARRAGRRRP